jgi:hypothetical protein
MRVTQKLTKLQKEEVYKISLDHLISNETVDKTIEAINNRTGLTISESHIWHLRARVRKNCKKRLLKMQTDRYEYMSHYFERIDEVKTFQRGVWDIIKKSKNEFNKLRCFTELREQTVILVDLYDHLPAVSSINVGAIANDFTETSIRNEVLSRSSEETDNTPSEAGDN